jgi:hypothetical protein
MQARSVDETDVLALLPCLDDALGGINNEKKID